MCFQKKDIDLFIKTTHSFILDFIPNFDANGSQTRICPTLGLFYPLNYCLGMQLVPNQGIEPCSPVFQTGAFAVKLIKHAYARFGTDISPRTNIKKARTSRF